MRDHKSIIKSSRLYSRCIENIFNGEIVSSATVSQRGIESSSFFASTYFKAKLASICFCSSSTKSGCSMFT